MAMAVAKSLGGATGSMSSSEEAQLRIFDPLYHASWCPWIFTTNIAEPPSKPPGWIWLLKQLAQGEGAYASEVVNNFESRVRELEERMRSAIGGLRQPKGRV